MQVDNLKSLSTKCKNKNAIKQSVSTGNMYRFEHKKQILPNIKLSSKQKDAFEVLDGKKDQNRESAENKPENVNSAFFIDLNKKDSLIIESSVRSNCSIKEIGNSDTRNINYNFDGSHENEDSNVKDIELEIMSKGNSLCVSSSNTEDTQFDNNIEAEEKENKTYKKVIVKDTVISKSEETEVEDSLQLTVELNMICENNKIHETDNMKENEIVEIETVDKKSVAENIPFCNNSKASKEQENMDIDSENKMSNVKSNQTESIETANDGIPKKNEQNISESMLEKQEIETFFPEMKNEMEQDAIKGFNGTKNCFIDEENKILNNDLESIVKLKNATSEVMTKSSQVNEEFISRKSIPDAGTCCIKHDTSGIESINHFSIDQNKQTIDKDYEKIENKESVQEYHKEVKSDSSLNAILKEGLIDHSISKEVENEADVVIPLITFENPSIEDIEQKIDNAEENKNEDKNEKNNKMIGKVNEYLTKETENLNQNSTETVYNLIDEKLTGVPR